MTEENCEHDYEYLGWQWAGDELFKCKKCGKRYYYLSDSEVHDPYVRKAISALRNIKEDEVNKKREHLLDLVRKWKEEEKEQT